MLMKYFFCRKITWNASFFNTTEPGKVMENMHGRKMTSVVINRGVGMTSSYIPYTGIRSSRDINTLTRQF